MVICLGCSLNYSNSLSGHCFFLVKIVSLYINNSSAVEPLVSTYIAVCMLYLTTVTVVGNIQSKNFCKDFSKI